jgi:hypothetical protein
MAFFFKYNRELVEGAFYGCSFLNFAINCSLVSLWARSGRQASTGQTPAHFEVSWAPTHSVHLSVVNFPSVQFPQHK